MLNLDKRPSAIHSLVRLMNIAMMTDPLTFVRLRVLGTPLFLYRSRTRPAVDGSGGTMYLLPFRATELADKSEFDCGDLEFVDQVNSATIPWSMLVQSG